MHSPEHEIEMSSNNVPVRALQQDARAWSDFTGTKYTAALRQMRSPLAQGLLGARVSARQLIRTLDEHALVGTNNGVSALSENGFLLDSPWRFDEASDYIELALITDFLRMFTPEQTPEVSSYSLKHTAEWFLGPRCSYVSNGRLIWAAAAMGLPIVDPDGEGPNLLIGVSEREHDYVRRAIGYGSSSPRADHYKPAAYEYMQDALVRAAAGEFIADAWVPPVRTKEPAPFHDWLVRQVGRHDVVGDLADDYTAGVRDSEHRIARTAEEMLSIFQEISHSPEAYDAVVASIAEWMQTDPASAPIRTDLITGGTGDHSGWGAGGGTMERYEYWCPCGAGEILEEHDNIPGFREHDVRILCDKCRDEWRFADGRSARGWALVPAQISAV